MSRLYVGPNGNNVYEVPIVRGGFNARAKTELDLRFDLRDDESPDCKNVIFQSGAIQKRRGYTTFGTSQPLTGAGNIIGLWAIPGASPLYLAIDGDDTPVKGYKTTGKTGAWTVLTMSDALGASPNVFDKYGLLMNGYFIFNGGAGVPYKYDLTSTITLLDTDSTFAACLSMLSINNYLHAAPTYTAGSWDENKQQLRRADIDTVEVWNGVGGSGTNVLLSTPGAITCMVKDRTTAYVGKDDSIWDMRWIGGSDLFRFNIVSEDINMPSASGVARASRCGLIFASADNIYRMCAGQQPVPVGDAIFKTLMADLDTANQDLQDIIAAHNPVDAEVWFIISGATKKIYVWNYALNIWYYFETADKIFSVATNNLNTFRTYGYDFADYIIFGSDAGKIYVYDKTTEDDDGTDIAAHWVSKDFVLSGLEMNDKLHRIELVHRATATNKELKFEIAVDGAAFTGTPHGTITPTSTWTSNWKRLPDNLIGRFFRIKLWSDTKDFQVKQFSLEFSPHDALQVAT